jgi:putative flippase GtrA
MPDIISAIVRFGVIGGGLTALSYLLFIGLIHLGLHYIIASALVWVVGVGLSYILNRRFTFGARRRATACEFGKFVGGYVLQFGLATALYALLIGRLGLSPSLAFGINLIATSSSNFAYMRLIVFSGQAQDAAQPI